MEAIQRTRNSSPIAGLFVAAVAAAVLGGAIGGYLVRSWTSREAAPVSVVANTPAKAADLLPAWVQNYTATAESPRLKVDEYISSLSQSGTTVNAEALLPAAVQQYITPAAAPQFKVDELIASLSYAGTRAEEQLPAWVQRYLTTDQTPQFKVDEFIASLN